MKGMAERECENGKKSMREIRGRKQDRWKKEVVRKGRRTRERWGRRKF